MCYHEPARSVQFTRMQKELIRNFNLVPAVLDSTGTNPNRPAFSMFYNKNSMMCLQRVLTDLHHWHPRNDGPDNAMEDFAGYEAYQLARYMPKLNGRKVRDANDVDDENPLALYKRCVENGYVHETYEDAVEDLRRRNLSTDDISAVNFLLVYNETTIARAKAFDAEVKAAKQRAIEHDAALEKAVAMELPQEMRVALPAVREPIYVR
jgi:hypothetical protein